jgi:hypothetical protein
MATNITAMSAATVANNRMRFFMHYLLKRGWDPSASPKVDQRAQCEGLQGLLQLPRTPLLGDSLHKAIGRPRSPA